MARVSIEHLSKVFPMAGREPIQAVKDLSLVVEDKELLVLVGPSGCGKTTTLRLIAGLEESTAGSILLDDQRLDSLPPKDRDVAMVFQSHALYPHLTVFENMAVSLKLRKHSNGEVERAVQEAAELLDLGPCLKMKPEQLSGGQKQRVALGRAIVRRPRLFLLDEPLSSLDAPLRVQMRREIVRLQRQLGTTMILVTHDQIDAMSVGQRIAVLKAGELQQVATPQNLYRVPANRFVAGFMGFPAMQWIHGVIRSHDERLWFETKAAGQEALMWPVDPKHTSRLAKQVNREVVLGARPEHLSLCSGTDRSGARFTAQLEWAEYLGAETILHTKLGSEVIRMRLLSAERFSFSPGAKLEVSVDMAQACYFDPENGLAVA